MGNCLNRLAFKPEEDDDEPQYERIQPRVSKIHENKNLL
jgi:hypothetical protein